MQQVWYRAGGMARADAVSQLRGTEKGTFLVRETIYTPTGEDTHTIDVQAGPRVVHILIRHVPSPIGQLFRIDAHHEWIFERLFDVIRFCSLNPFTMANLPQPVTLNGSMFKWDSTNPTPRTSPMSTRSASPAPAEPQPAAAKPTPCCQCLEAPACVAFVPCGHVCMCASCGMYAHMRHQPCPICRSTSSTTIRLYFS
eukprot:m.250047 g.250047  ORF g.250047 m.250047 type:complete len:198 (+) comp16520_c0_seq1:203-796(+)